MEELAPGVYYEPSFRGVNLGLVVTEEGVVSVDTPMLPMVAEAWQEQAERFGPIRYILNSDHLQEHTMGNFYLPGEIIAHDETRGRMRMTDKAKDTYRKFVIDMDAEGAEDYVEAYELRYPNITLFDRLTIFLGGRTLEFIHLPGHTPNSVGLYLPDVRLLFTGDVVVNRYRPYLGLASVDEWLMTLKAIEVMEVSTIVPGHGAPMKPNQLGPLGRAPGNDARARGRADRQWPRPRRGGFQDDAPLRGVAHRQHPPR